MVYAVYPRWGAVTVDCHLRFNADAMLHRDAVTVLFPGEPSRREVDLSAAHLELEWQNRRLEDGAPSCGERSSESAAHPPGGPLANWTATLTSVVKVH